MSGNGSFVGLDLQGGTFGPIRQLGRCFTQQVAVDISHGVFYCVRFQGPIEGGVGSILGFSLSTGVQTALIPIPPQLARVRRPDIRPKELQPPVQ